MAVSAEAAAAMAVSAEAAPYVVSLGRIEGLAFDDVEDRDLNVKLFRAINNLAFSMNTYNGLANILPLHLLQLDPPHVSEKNYTKMVKRDIRYNRNVVLAKMVGMMKLGVFPSVHLETRLDCDVADLLGKRRLLTYALLLAGGIKEVNHLNALRRCRSPAAVEAVVRQHLQL